MISKQVLVAWLKTLPAQTGVAIDEGGLAMVELDENSKPTGAYIEIGGVPLEGDEA